MRTRLAICCAIAILILDGCRRNAAGVSLECDQLVADPAAPPTRVTLVRGNDRTVPADSSALVVRTMSSRDSSPVAFEVLARLVRSADTLAFLISPATRTAALSAAPGKYLVHLRCISCERVDQEWEARAGYADTLIAAIRLSRNACETTPMKP